MKKETVITKDSSNKKLLVVREFDAPVEQVWKAWTDSNILDQWWAPKPWRAKTKNMDFREGGVWLYAMVGPKGEESYCRTDFKTIDAPRSFTITDVFCDEDGQENTDFPRMDWVVNFSEEGGNTKVEVEVSFATEADLEKLVEMGFKEGFTAAHGNLDELLAKEYSL